MVIACYHLQLPALPAAPNRPHQTGHDENYAQQSNSSVATIPTLFDLILKGKLKAHNIVKGDTLVFASVGAGMNINTMIYKM